MVALGTYDCEISPLSTMGALSTYDCKISPISTMVALSTYDWYDSVKINDVITKYI